MNFHFTSGNAKKIEFCKKKIKYIVDNNAFLHYYSN